MRFVVDEVPKGVVGQSTPRGRIIGMVAIFLFLQSWLIASNRGPLCEAAREGDVETIERLLAEGYNIHSSNGSRFTPLHEAARAGHFEVAKLLVVRGARVNNHPRYYGRTALHEAAKYGHTKVILLLLENGAEVNAVARESIFQCPYHLDRTALYYAASSGHASTVQSLLRAGAKLYETSDDQEHLLFDVVKGDHRAVARLLLDYGADVNGAKYGLTDDRGKTPLYFVRSREMAELLLWAGARLHDKDKRGAAVLHYVLYCSPRSVELIDFLIKKGASVHGRDSDGQMPLHWLANHIGSRAGGSIRPTIQVLLKHGADVNAQDRRGWTPLHVAATVEEAFKGSTTTMQALLAQGADVNAQDHRGNTPLHRAAAESHYAFKEGCEDYEKTYLPNTQVLLCAGANPDVRNEAGYTPLDEAWHAGHKAVFKELIARGAEFLSREPGEFVSAKGNRMSMAFYVECRALARARYQAIASLLEALIDMVGIDVVNQFVLPDILSLSDIQREQLKEIQCSNEIVFQLSSYFKFVKFLFFSRVQSCS